MVEGKVEERTPAGARVWQRRLPARCRARLHREPGGSGVPAVQLLLVCYHSLAMFHAFGNYFQERRRGLTKVAGFVGGAYMVGRYVSQRLDDVRNSILLERAARDK